MTATLTTQHFLLLIPGRDPFRIAAISEGQLARQISHRDVGGITSRQLAAQAWDTASGYEVRSGHVRLRTTTGEQ